MELDWVAESLSLQVCKDVNGDVGLGEVLAVQSSAGHAVTHVGAELAVGRTCVHGWATGPVAEGVHDSTGVLAL